MYDSKVWNFEIFISFENFSLKNKISNERGRPIGLEMEHHKDFFKIILTSQKLLQNTYKFASTHFFISFVVLFWIDLESIALNFYLYRDRCLAEKHVPFSHFSFQF